MLSGRMRRLPICILLCSASILSHSDQSIEELVRGEWHCPEVEYLYIRFISDFYLIGAYEGAGDLASGDYKFLDSRRISLSKPVFDPVGFVYPEYLDKVKTWVNKLWSMEKLVLRYNPNYVTLSITGSLDTESGLAVFTSTIETREGVTIWQYGKKNIKEKNRFFVLENLIIHSSPSIESESKYYEISEFLKAKKGITISYYGLQHLMEGKARIVPKGYELETFARTIDLDRISGQKAPWYLCCIQLDYGEYIGCFSGWVFGGYLSKYSENKSSEYRSILGINLLELGWLPPTENAQ